MFPEGEQDCYISTGSNGDDKVPTNIGSDDKVPIKRIIADKVPIISQESANKLADIIIYLGNHSNSKSNSIVRLLGVGETSSKKYLRKLIEWNSICPPDSHCKVRNFSRGSQGIIPKQQRCFP